MSQTLNASSLRTHQTSLVLAMHVCLANPAAPNLVGTQMPKFVLPQSKTSSEILIDPDAPSSLATVQILSLEVVGS